LLDDGRLTDSKGNVVNFRNTIVIFTSNIGSTDILDIDPANSELVRSRVMAALQARFRPEFLNRIDEFVTFSSLGMDQLTGIVALELQRVGKRLADKELGLSVTDGAKQWLATRGFDPVYGARPLKRTVQREVETPVAKLLLEGKFESGSSVMLDARPGDDRLTITSVPSSGGKTKKQKAGDSKDAEPAVKNAEEMNFMQ
jgi:ATP-dependent Clp protease ATP-binding subunit ClpB